MARGRSVQPLKPVLPILPVVVVTVTTTTTLPWLITPLVNILLQWAGPIMALMGSHNLPRILLRQMPAGVNTAVWTARVMRWICLPGRVVTFCRRQKWLITALVPAFLPATMTVLAGSLSRWMRRSSSKKSPIKVLPAITSILPVALVVWWSQLIPGRN